MKRLQFIALALVIAFLGACTEMDDIMPETGDLLQSQVQRTMEVITKRAEAQFLGMYVLLGDPYSIIGNIKHRPDDFGFIMSDFSNDVEAADVVLADNNYNWFSVCCELTTRNGNYANPTIRYNTCYNAIMAANGVLLQFESVVKKDDPNPEPSRLTLYAMKGQAYAIRAFSYLRLAPYFQFNRPYEAGGFAKYADLPCVPIVVNETPDVSHNPRATVGEVYRLIINDLTEAIDLLDGWKRDAGFKGRIDQQVAYGLRARTYLLMGECDSALADAERAAEGYEPASIEEVSKPSFMDVNEHNWLWGYDMTNNVAAKGLYATASSWIRSFSAYAYSAGTGTYARINNILYDKIPFTDVRKGWWVDEKLFSPLLNGLTWGTLSGQEIASGFLPDVKEPFDSYTNVKFGCKPVGTTFNAEDWPFMRVEEMLLIQAECKARLGDEEGAKKILTDFVKNYRDPNYNVDGRKLSLLDEIWFQRRVELWGEGFANVDTRRLGKPLVRLIDPKTSIVPDAFRFNMTYDDRWWLMRFSVETMNTNHDIVDNAGGNLPKTDQHADLRDGVTD